MSDTVQFKREKVINIGKKKLYWWKVLTLVCSILFFVLFVLTPIISIIFFIAGTVFAWFASFNIETLVIFEETARMYLVLGVSLTMTIVFSIIIASFNSMSAIAFLIARIVLGRFNYLKLGCDEICNEILHKVFKKRFDAQMKANKTREPQMISYKICRFNPEGLFKALSEHEVVSYQIITAHDTIYPDVIKPHVPKEKRAKRRSSRSYYDWLYMMMILDAIDGDD